jgi:hypothetical protein
MVKLGDKVQYQSKDAYVTKVSSDGKTIDVIQNGQTFKDVTDFGEAVSSSSIQDLSKSNNASDMSASSAGSQRNTNQADSSDMDSNKIPAPGTGDTAGGLSADGRGKQHLDSEIVDRTSGNTQTTQASSSTSPSTTVGSTGIRAKDFGVSKEIRDKMDEPVWVRRMHGTEEVLVQANRGTLRILDKNGRRLEIGNVVSLPVRIVGLYSADEVEVVYPPYIPVVEEVPTINEGQLKNADGSNYNGTLYTINDSNEVVDVNTKQPPNMDEMPKQNTLTVASSQLDRS